MKKIFLFTFFGSILSTSISAQSTNDSAFSYNKELQKQKIEILNQQAALQKLHESELNQIEAQKKQDSAAENQIVLAKEQANQAKIQEQMMNAIKQEMMNDGLIENGEKYEIIINNNEMIVNGKKVLDSLHAKYMKLIESKRNKPFEASEEWRINDKKFKRLNNS